MKKIESLQLVQITGAQSANAYIGQAAAITADGVQIVVVAPDRESLNRICCALNVNIGRLDPAAIYPVALVHESQVNIKDGEL